MSPEDLKNVLETVTNNNGMSLAELIAAVTGITCCIITVCAFVRAILNSGFDEQKKALGEINSTLIQMRVNNVSHDTCAKRQENLIKRLGLDEIRRRLTKLEDSKENDHEHNND